MTVVPDGRSYKILTPFGQASFEALTEKLRISVETDDWRKLNRLKQALVGPITFIAATEKLDIRWVGDEVGLSPLEDLRILHVKYVTQLTPGMRRIVFCGGDLSRFDRPDQIHCRLIFQPKGVTAPEWPMLDDRGQVIWPAQRRLPTRVYTIRKIDAAKGEITIDFALHGGAGPATLWAFSASTGDIVGVLGPAAGGPKQAEFYVLAGDETGLPGIARILEWIDRKSSGVALIEINSPTEQQLLVGPPGIELRWLYRGGMAQGKPSLLPDAVRSINWPADRSRSFFWGGCEHTAFREIHRILRKDVGLSRDQQVMYSHWHHSLNEEEIIAIGADAYLP